MERILKTFVKKYNGQIYNLHRIINGNKLNLTKINSRKHTLCSHHVREYGMSSVKKTQNNLLSEVTKFSIDLKVESASTPPSTWFNDYEFYLLDKEAVFKKNWIAIGRADQLQKPGQYFSGEIADEPFILVRDKENKLQGFFNVCRHHAAQIVKYGEGSCDKFICPYHGWTYSLNGRLAKATRLKGIENFSAKNFGLVPIRTATLGPFVFGYFGDDNPPNVEDQFKPICDIVDNELGLYQGLSFVKRVQYQVNCNWKVFVDNYLDGGYHVPILHKDLTGNLDMSTYKVQLFNDSANLQSCAGVGSERIGRQAYFAYFYPNFMMNRYGPWLDTNLVLPDGHHKCQVVYDYYLDDAKINSFTPEELKNFVSASLKDSDQVQEEDRTICENVQKGLKSSAYDVGRYAPSVELADHQFHQKLANDYRKHLNIETH